MLTHNRVRRAKNRKGEDVIDKTDNGARPEIVALRGWLGGFTEYSPAIANLWAREITSDDIEDAIEKMGNAVSAETKRRRLAVLVAVGRHAAAAGEPHLLAALRSAKWPAKSALQPGREITHAEWLAIMAHTRRVEPLTLAAAFTLPPGTVARIARAVGGRPDDTDGLALNAFVIGLAEYALSRLEADGLTLTLRGADDSRKAERLAARCQAMGRWP